MKDVISQGRNPEKKCRYCKFSEHGNRFPDPGPSPKAVFCTKNQVRVSMSLTCASFEFRPTPLASLVEPPKTFKIEVSQKELTVIKKALQEREAFLQPDLLVIATTYERNAPTPEELAAERTLLRDLRAKLSFVGPDGRVS